ncbi:MAG TPA: hypothetical protein VLD57_06670 [Blastocatellia bacterium]|nr:hypothetical protein [Blastocatellia bacterium]
MSADYDHAVEGEVIKMIHDELPAVRWTCGECGEDTATIFEPEEIDRVVVCDYCKTSNLVRRAKRD